MNSLKLLICLGSVCLSATQGFAIEATLLQRFIPSNQKAGAAYIFEYDVYRLASGEFKTRVDVSYARKKADNTYTPLKVVDTGFSKQDIEHEQVIFDQGGNRGALLLDGPSIKDPEVTVDCRWWWSPKAQTEVNGYEAHDYYLNSIILVVKP